MSNTTFEKDFVALMGRTLSDDWRTAPLAKIRRFVELWSPILDDYDEMAARDALHWRQGKSETTTITRPLHINGGIDNG